MAAPGKERRGVGLRKITLFALDADGGISTPLVTYYDGVQAVGGKELGMSQAEPSPIYHTGDDVVLDVDFLPSEEALISSFTLSGLQDEVDELLTNINSVEINENRFMVFGTNDADDGPQVCVLAYRQSLDASGTRVWESTLFPKAKVVPLNTRALNREPGTKQYRVFPQFSNEYPWGTDFAIGTEGATRAQGVDGVHNYQPKMVTFNGDNATLIFLFPVDAQAATTAEVTVWEDGVEVVDGAGVTVATTGVTFDAAPGTDADVVVFYGVAP